MKGVRPTRLAFRGRVEASGVLLADSAEGRLRALARWHPGAVIQRSAGRGLLMRFAAPERIPEATAPGTLLVAQHGVWASAPVTKAEAEGFDPAAVLVARGGALQAVEATGAVDASEWLDVGAYTVVPAEPLPEPPRPIAVAASAPRLDLRARVKDPETKQALLDALRDSGAVKAPPRWKRWFKRAAKRGEGKAGPPNAWSRLEHWLSKRLEATKAGRWLIDRQSAYFDRLSKMFDDDLDEALRHAIALEGDPAPGAPTGRSLKMPAPRAGLGLTFGAGTGTGPAIQMEGDRYARLRAQYREAAKKLEAEGRIEEAAFVLTDLLNAPADAVELLYRHQKYALAAQLAEGRSLDPALVVRLWFLAGDAPRAVRIARKTKTFATALSKLEGHPEAATRLRMLWADALAEGGDFAGAVHLAVSVPEALPLVLKWLDLAVDAGGPDAIRLSVLRFDLAPGDTAPSVARIHALLDDPSPERAAERQALGEALLSGLPGSDALRKVLGRPAVRALVRDRALHGVKNEPLVRKLLDRDEGALRTDVPATFPTAPPRQRPSDFWFRPDGSGLVAHDAAFLPGGRMLVALGENGLALVGADGRTVWRDEHPAFALAVDPSGGFAVTRTPRGEATNLARVSVARRKVEDWARVPLSAAAAEVHGGLWMMASGGALLALDALTTPASALWQYPLGGGTPLALCADPTGHAMLVQDAAATRLYQLLVPRNLPTPVGPQWVVPGVVHAAACALTGFACVGVNLAGQPRAWVFTPGTGQVAEQVLDGMCAGAPAMTLARVAIATRVNGGVRVAVTPGTLRLHFDQATRVGLRFHGDVLVVAPDTGRVVAFDCAQTVVLRDLVVRVGR